MRLVALRTASPDELRLGRPHAPGRAGCGPQSAVAAVQIAGRIEEAILRPRVRVPVVGDPAAFGIDPVAVRVALVRDAFEAFEQPGLQVGFRKAVRAPHDHRRPAHQAVGDPALVVLEMPLRDVFGAAEQAVGIAHAFGRVRSTVSPTATPCRARSPCATSTAPTKGVSGPYVGQGSAVHGSMSMIETILSSWSQNATESGISVSFIQNELCTGSVHRNAIPS